MRTTDREEYIKILNSKEDVILSDGRSLIQVLTEHYDWLHRTPNTSYTKARLEGENLAGLDLSRVKLDWANLEGANLSNAILYEASLVYARLIGTNLTSTDLSNSELEDAIIIESTLNYANLSYANLNGAKISYSLLMNASLRGVNLNGVYWVNCDLENVDFRYTDMSSTEFIDCYVPGLSGADINRSVTSNSKHKTRLHRLFEDGLSGFLEEHPDNYGLPEEHYISKAWVEFLSAAHKLKSKLTQQYFKGN